ncbi:MAG: DUF3887 domain-containing protein [Anaerolineales bacterium]
MLVLTLMLVMLAGLSGCSPKRAGISDQQVSSMTENILRSIDTNNYPGFTHDFSKQMKSVFTQEKFSQLRTLLSKTSGIFLYIDLPNVSDNQGYAVYRFPAKYADETVYVNVTYVIGGQEVEGLFFDSPNLRKASQ